MTSDQSPRGNLLVRNPDHYVFYLDYSAFFAQRIKTFQIVQTLLAPTRWFPDVTSCQLKAEAFWME